MKFELPRLPYAPDALTPAISAQTVEYHYGKHTKAYIDNVNKLVEGTAMSNMALEQIVKIADPGPLFNNAAQAWNHLLYFSQFNPNGEHEPDAKSALAKQINKQFGSFDELKRQMIAAGTALFGSGWVWLSADMDGQLFITITSNAGTPLTDGLTPLLVIDVWEHAYYLDYQNLRAQYLENIWSIIDWNIIETRNL